MMLCLFLKSIFILLLPLVYSGNVTFPTQEINSNLTKNADSSDRTKLVVPSEGGTLLASTSDLSLPKDKLTTLLALDEEIEKPKETSIKPRKGVGNFTEDQNYIHKSTSNELQNSSVTLTSGNATIESHTIISKILQNVTAKNNTLAISKQINSTEPPKKPLILSYEALVNADKNNNKDDIKIPVIHPSTKTLPSIAKSQIPSPNEDAIVKVYPSKANSHPGMIMPIVISILVVPMFAILGYMALRRAQEAWKNRHYKRMDFLLDGMYND